MASYFPFSSFSMTSMLPANANNPHLLPLHHHAHWVNAVFELVSGSPSISLRLISFSKGPICIILSRDVTMEFGLRIDSLSEVRQGFSKLYSASLEHFLWLPNSHPSLPSHLHHFLMCLDHHHSLENFVWTLLCSNILTRGDSKAFKELQQKPSSSETSSSWQNE